MCPECGGRKTPAVSTSHDAEWNKIRRRKCEECGTSFSTVELVFPFSFHEADDGKRQRASYGSHVPMYEPTYFVSELGRVITRTTSRRSHKAFYPDPNGTAMVLRLVRSNKKPRCRKGIHVMYGNNVYRHPNGFKVCNACRREAANRLYRHRMDAARARRAA